MQVTLGGDRLGSGNKNKIALHNYERSTHDLTQKFTSSLQCGTLYPFLVLPAMRGDKFTIDLEAAARTIPTKGPLFGSFKMQVDLFQCDVRLYQAILHNNPLSIGLKMSLVKFPQLQIRDAVPALGGAHAFSNTSLMKYLGLSGIGTTVPNPQTGQVVWRNINAIPALAYYEIFKTYYSNKQEENAYVIGQQTEPYSIEDLLLDIGGSIANAASVEFDNSNKFRFLNASAFTDLKENLYLNFTDETDEMLACITLEKAEEIGVISKESDGRYAFTAPAAGGVPWATQWTKMIFTTNYRETKEDTKEIEYTYTKWGLQPFALANIDDMRLKLLSHHELGVPFKIIDTETTSNDYWGSNSGTDRSGLPYINLVKTIEGYTQNAKPLNGLVVKTYQSDLFNNWVNTEWIDGENGIANVTAISTADGNIKIDAINLAEKLYNMLNRIAVSDGSYEGWQDAVYTETPKRHIESPVYLGGMSSEVMFEEIVQTSADGEGLGTLAGKGVLIKNKGGHVNVTCNEAAFIIGIVSLTPRVNYCQGNEWYLTELQSMDDFHKPALDGIGFQNLIGERLAWWDTKVKGHSTIESRSTIGKVPAWIEYMTAVDKCYGDFAETEGRGFMALQRDYEMTEEFEIADATTYIDPRKYNYAFAYTDIDAQNFWVQIKSNITARRLMSAKQIPNI